MKEDLMEKNAMVAVESLTVNAGGAAKMLGVCERTVRNLTKQGVLPVIRIASRVLYSIEDLTEFVRQRSKREINSGIENHDCVSSLE